MTIKVMKTLAGAVAAAVLSGCMSPVAMLTADQCRHTGVPSIAVSPVNGRLWVTYYCGPTPGEDSNSVVPLLTSADGGETWRQVGEVRPEPGHRVFDPELWVAPDGTLRWTYTSRACRSNDPRNLAPYAGDEGDVSTDRLMMATIDAETPFAKPPKFRQVAEGVMMNKPLAMKDGTWLLPVARWRGEPSACFYASTDGGKTFDLRGGISHFPAANRLYDEHTVIERNDGSLLAFIRGKENPTVLESESWDGGRTWMTGRRARFEHTSSRHALRRLKSGNLLLVKNGPVKEDIGRSRLMAFLSQDDGVTWSNGLLLDDRERVSYPDFDQRADGMIVAVHDFDRLNFQQIVVDVFSEADVLAGRFQDPRAKKGLLATAYTPKVIFDTDMLTDFDDVGALACLHAMADAGECEILATVTSTRGNASVAAVEVINAYYGRPGLPVGAPSAPAIMGACAWATNKIDAASPVGRTDADGQLNEGDHYKYRKLAADYPQWVKHLDADDAPDAVRVYRQALAAAPDGSVVICTVGFLTNVGRLLESGPDDVSPLDGTALVSKKVKKLVSMACAYPKGKEFNSMWDAAASKRVLERWPTPVYFSDFDYGFTTYAGRAIAETEGQGNPVKDIFKENMPSRETIASDPEHWRDCAFGMAGRSAWDETAVLLAVRGPDAYFGLERGEFRMIGEDGENEWRTDWVNGRHWRIIESMPKTDVGRVIDELICRGPKVAPKTDAEVKIDATWTGAVLPNVSRMLTVWNGTGFKLPPKQAGEYPIDFVEYVELMACTGGQSDREHFRNPSDRSVADDYDFTKIIETCRGIVKAGAKPYLKLGNVPAKLSADQDGGEFSINIRPPSDHLAHYRYLKALAETLKREFGRDEVRTWWFAVLTEADNIGWFRARSGNHAETREEFFKLYDYAAKAFFETLGDGLVFGTHMLYPDDPGVTSQFSVKDVAEHCARGKNYATGGIGAPLGLLTISYYVVPRHGEQPFDCGGGFKVVKDALAAAGITDVITGIDEGRVIVATPGRDRNDIVPRAVGQSYEPAFDVRMTRQLLDAGADYAATWGYFAGPDSIAGNLPSHHYFSCRELARFAGLRRAAVTAVRAPAYPEAVDVIAGVPADGGGVRFALGRFMNDLVFTNEASVAVEVQLSRSLAGREVTIETLTLDDRNNWFTLWERDRRERGIADSDYSWSPDGFTVMTKHGLVSESHQTLFSELAPGYASLAASVAPVRRRCRVRPDGTLRLTLSFRGNGAAFVTVSGGTEGCFWYNVVEREKK